MNKLINMKSKIYSYNQIYKELKEEFPNLNDFELLSLAIQIERNTILENGLVVSSDDKLPSGLEAVAMALGVKSEQGNYTIVDAITDLRTN